VITINHFSLPSPHALSVQIDPRGGTSQYNSLGQLVQEGIQDKRTVEIAWRRITGEQLALISQALQPGGFFTLSYPDPLMGQRGMQCFLKRQAAHVWQYEKGIPKWADVKLTLEER